MISRWYLRSVAVIDETMRQLPKTATKVDAVKSLRDAYPFGERKMYPYKQWCKAQREALILWFPEAATKTDTILPPLELFRTS